jgi:hypothetical protein
MDQRNGMPVRESSQEKMSVLNWDGSLHAFCPPTMSNTMVLPVYLPSSSSSSFRLNAPSDRHECAALRSRFTEACVPALNGSAGGSASSFSDMYTTSFHAFMDRVL